MAAILFCAMVLVFHLLIFNLVKGESKSCPKEFNCGKLGNMSYPFSEIKKPLCGLCKIDCNNTLQNPIVEIEGESYIAHKKWFLVNSIDLSDPILDVYLANRSCKSFERNLSFPNSPSVSFGVSNNITLFKCMNRSMEIDGFFRSYENYSKCDGFTLYYHKPRTNRRRSIPTGVLPANCAVIRLPLTFLSPSDPISDDLFDLLSSKFKLDWEVSRDCSDCIYREGQCQSNSKNLFVCSKVAGNTKGKVIVAVTVFLISCTGILILLFCFRKKIVWYKYIRFWESNAEDHRNIEAFLKNYGSYAPKRYTYSEVKSITSGFKNKLGQGGFGSVYKGTLPNGSHVAVKVFNQKIDFD